MNAITIPPPLTAPHDADLAEQAHPHHGIPSQDPDPAAQFPLQAGEAEREAKSVLTGGGLVGGAALGTALGVAMGGPLGVVLGCSLGAIAGVLAGEAAGSLLKRGSSGWTGAGPMRRA